MCIAKYDTKGESTRPPTGNKEGLLLLLHPALGLGLVATLGLGLGLGLGLRLRLPSVMASGSA